MNLKARLSLFFLALTTASCIAVISEDPAVPDHFDVFGKPVMVAPWENNVQDADMILGIGYSVMNLGEDEADARDAALIDASDRLEGMFPGHNFTLFERRSYIATSQNVLGVKVHYQFIARLSNGQRVNFL